MGTLGGSCPYRVPSGTVMGPKRGGDPVMAMHARELVNQKGILVVPAVYDALSAKIAERVGFKAVGLGGFLVAASRLGLPDVGYLTMSEMVEACRAMAGAGGISGLGGGGTGDGEPPTGRGAP